MGGEHFGLIKIKSGTLNIEKQQAEVIVDMDSIDVANLDGEWKDKLMNHLRSDDFFSVKKYQTAILKINKMTKNKNGSYQAVGTLQIKNITQPISIEVKEEKGEYTGELTFNRTLFDIKYKSAKFFENLGDKLIYDEVQLKFKIATN